MDILLEINPDQISESEAASYAERLAARGVIYDDHGNIALLPVGGNYYKLPGGGVEDGEDVVSAFKRECLEEIGFEIEVISEIGKIVEYRSQKNLKQTSHCFIARTTGEKKEIRLTEHELNQGYGETIWVPLEEAYKLVSSSKPSNYGETFIIPRDSFILDRTLALKN